MLYEEDAVEVVDFVAEGARQKILSANFKSLALDVLRFHGDKLGANDVAAKAGDGKAAFFFPNFALGVGDLGIG